VTETGRFLEWLMPTIQIETPHSDDVLALLRQGDEFALALYPVESYYGLDLEALEADDAFLFVAREGGAALGTAAIVDRGDGSAEIKRMFVTDAARGLGIGHSLLDALETHARISGISTLQLETGLPQVAAIALYEKHGYEQIPRFGKYEDDPTSYCMQKHL
jgi:putative acetyltransferase